MMELDQKAPLPCPHCGSHAKPKVMDWDGNGFPGYEVRCDGSGWEGLDERGCGAAGGWGETPDEAVAAWNRRTLSAAVPAEVGGPIQRLRENLASFDAEVASELLNEGERADLWTDIDVNVDDLRSVLTAIEAQAAELAAAKAECDEHKRLKNALVLKAYPAMDGADDLVEALGRYGFPVSEAAEPALMEGGSIEARALHKAAKGFIAARRALTGGQEDG